VSDDDEGLDLLTKTSGASAFLAHAKKVDQLTHASRAGSSVDNMVSAVDV
jgi:hypothetical protein